MPESAKLLTAEEFDDELGIAFVGSCDAADRLARKKRVELIQARDRDVRRQTLEELILQQCGMCRKAQEHIGEWKPAFQTGTAWWHVMPAVVSPIRAGHVGCLAYWLHALVARHDAEKEKKP